MKHLKSKKITNLFSLIPIGIVAGTVMVFTDAFAYKKAIGWHWYNELPFVKEKKERDERQMKNEQKEQEEQEKQEKREKQEKQENVANKEEESSLASTTAVIEIKKLRGLVEEAKAKAILVPTEVNVRDYISLQNYVAAKATVFSQVWQKVLLDYPDLDLRVVSPTQSAIQSVVYEERRKREIEAIKYFRERYGLLFFYRGNNPLDSELAMVVNTFVQENNISFIPISVDGKALDMFATSGKINSGQAEKLGVRHFPALILVDPGGKKVRPLNYGFISSTELRERFLHLATDFKEGV